MKTQQWAGLDCLPIQILNQSQSQSQSEQKSFNPLDLQKTSSQLLPTMHLMYCRIRCTQSKSSTSSKCRRTSLVHNIRNKTFRIPNFTDLAGHFGRFKRASDSEPDGIWQKLMETFSIVVETEISIVRVCRNCSAVSAAWYTSPIRELGYSSLVKAMRLRYREPSSERRTAKSDCEFRRT